MRSPNATFPATVLVREQRIVLEHQTEAPLVRRRLGDVVSIPPDRPDVGWLEAGDHPEETGLPGSRRSHDREDLAARNAEVDGIERRCGAVAEGHRAEFEHQISSEEPRRTASMPKTAAAVINMSTTLRAIAMPKVVDPG